MVTTCNLYPLPRMEKRINSLGEAQVISAVDGNSDCREIVVKETDEAITAFTSHQRLNRFTHMLFRLKNSPATFQRVTDIMLSSVK